MKTVACIIAMTASTRLPKKVLREINGKKLIEYIIEKMKYVPNLDDIYLCTSIDDDDKILLDIAEENGIKGYAGSRESVIDRMLDVAEIEHIGKPSKLLTMLWRIFVRISFLWHLPSIMNVICVAAIFSLFLPILKIGSLEFSPMYSVILSYGITLPILSLLLLFKHVVFKDTDRAYNTLVNDLAVNKSEKK